MQPVLILLRICEIIVGMTVTLLRSVHVFWFLDGTAFILLFDLMSQRLSLPTHSYNL